MKRRKKRGVYFLNRPAPTERAWLLEHGATEEDMAFPDPATDPVAGLFPDPQLRERFAPLLERLRAAPARSLLFDDARGVVFRAFQGVGPPDRSGDNPEGLILVRAPDSRVRLQGLADDAPGARDLVAFYRGGLGALTGGDDLLGLGLPAEIQPWSRARKHDLGLIDFLPEHRTRNLRIFWDWGEGIEVLFDATGKVFEYRGGAILHFRYDAVLRFLEEAAVRIAAGRGGGLIGPEEIEAVAPGHPLVEIFRLRSPDLRGRDPAELRAALKGLEGAGYTREEIGDLNLAVLAREERWEEFTQEMRRLVQAPNRSAVDREENWQALVRAAAARARPGDFREIALSAVGGPLRPETRGVICDLLMDSGDLDAAVAVLERSMRPGQPLHPDLARRVERLRGLRSSRR